jgi:1-pyrroline dehydrogenase
MSVTVASYQNFVAGKWVDAVEGGTAQIVNPATGEAIADVPTGTQADVDRAVEAAVAALPEWLETTPGERAEALLKLADAIDANTDELAQLESQNVGKPLPAARDEMPVCSDNIRFFAGAARILEGRSTGEYMRGYTSWIRREPVGVVGQVAPWNYPLMMAVWKIAPALAAGNVVVLKPSEQTPLTALRMAQLAAEIFPAGVLNVITGDGEPVGAGLMRHPDVRMVSLTGDVATGKEVARAAAETLKRVHLELGGKAPVVVFDDADPAQVAEAIKIAGYWNSGQDCTAASRVVAGPRIYDKLLDELVPAIESMKVGDPAEGDDVEMGPVVSREQQDRVLGFLDRAESSGATVLTGGTSRFPQTPSTGPLRGQALRAGTNGDRGFFVQPTVITDVGQTDEIVQREVFGPVVTVQRFADDDEALAWANDVSYGLAASIFTRDIGRALNASRKLEFGTVWINDHIPLVSEMPHGGYKHSGYGKDLSLYSLEDYTQIKHVMAKLD